MKSFEYIIKDELGIHARPAGLLVKEAKETGCKVTIEKDDKKIDASRLFSVMGLGVKCGDRIIISCDGENEEQSLMKMKTFFEANL